MVGVKPVPLTLTLVTNGSGCKFVGIVGVWAEAALAPFWKFNVQDPRFAVESKTVLEKRFAFTPSFKLGRLIVPEPNKLAVAVVPFCPFGMTEFSPN